MRLKKISWTSVKDLNDVCDSLVKSMLCGIVAKAKVEQDPGYFDSVLCSLQQINYASKFQLGDPCEKTLFPKRYKMSWMSIFLIYCLLTYLEILLSKIQLKILRPSTTIYNAHTSICTNFNVSEASSAATLTHSCLPFQNLLSERLTSLGIMGAPRVPPLNPSETIVLSEHYRLWGV